MTFDLDFCSTKIQPSNDKKMLRELFVDADVENEESREWDYGDEDKVAPEKVDLQRCQNIVEVSSHYIATYHNVGLVVPPGRPDQTSVIISLNVQQLKIFCTLSNIFPWLSVLSQ